MNYFLKEKPNTIKAFGFSSLLYCYVENIGIEPMTF